jgi:hypothetical protein
LAKSNHKLTICDWQDSERADKMARRTAGLEAEETKVNVNLNLVNERILAMQLA